MIYFKYIILSFLIFLASCASNKQDIKAKKKYKSKTTLIKNSDPFYPLQESIKDIQNQVIDLKSKVIEYESRLHAPVINMELLKLAQAPNLKHDIIMTNGTIIQGTIIFENTEQMIVKTQIGQLTIEKAFVSEIKEIEPLEPFIEFSNEKTIEERIEKDNLISYVGEIINNGSRRGDFVRVIYHFWADDTSPIHSDSSFVKGENTIFLNGVISDASINPSETGTFELNILIPDTLQFEYITKEIHWDTFD